MRDQRVAAGSPTEVAVLLVACSGCYTHATLVAIDEARGWRRGAGVPPVEVELTGVNDDLRVHVRYADGSRRVASWVPFGRQGKWREEHGRLVIADSVARITSREEPLALGTVWPDGQPYRRILAWGENSLELVEEPLGDGFRRGSSFWLYNRRCWTRREDEQRLGEVVLLAMALPFALSLDLALWSVAIPTCPVWGTFINGPGFVVTIANVFPDPSRELAYAD